MDAEMALNNRRKSIVIKLALIFGAMIIFLTFFSKNNKQHTATCGGYRQGKEGQHWKDN